MAHPFGCALESAPAAESVARGQRRLHGTGVLGPPHGAAAVPVPALVQLPVPAERAPHASEHSQSLCTGAKQSRSFLPAVANQSGTT